MTLLRLNILKSLISIYILNLLGFPSNLTHDTNIFWSLHYWSENLIYKLINLSCIHCLWLRCLGRVGPIKSWIKIRAGWSRGLFEFRFAGQLNRSWGGLFNLRPKWGNLWHMILRDLWGVELLCTTLWSSWDGTLPWIMSILPNLLREKRLSFRMFECFLFNKDSRSSL